MGKSGKGSSSSVIGEMGETSKTQEKIEGRKKTERQRVLLSETVQNTKKSGRARGKIPKSVTGIKRTFGTERSKKEGSGKITEKPSHKARPGEKSVKQERKGEKEREKLRKKKQVRTEVSRDVEGGG